MLRSSRFARSFGDEAGRAGGILSGAVEGSATFVNYSFDVVIEGENVPRALDPMLHNQRSPPNAGPTPELQIVKVIATTAMLCLVFCHCNTRGAKTMCAQQALADSLYAESTLSEDGRAAGPTNAFDPKYPGVWVEVTYLPLAEGGWEVVFSNRFSSRWTGEKGLPLPLPQGDRNPPAMSRRPDVVLTKDPHAPPVVGNVQVIYDFKFDGDPADSKRSLKQFAAFAEIAGFPPIALDRLSCWWCDPLMIALVVNKHIEDDQHDKLDQMLERWEREAWEHRERVKEERERLDRLWRPFPIPGIGPLPIPVLVP